MNFRDIIEQNVLSSDEYTNLYSLIRDIFGYSEIRKWKIIENKETDSKLFEDIFIRVYFTSLTYGTIKIIKDKNENITIPLRALKTSKMMEIFSSIYETNLFIERHNKKVAKRKAIRKIISKLQNFNFKEQNPNITEEINKYMVISDDLRVKIKDETNELESCLSKINKIYKKWNCEKNPKSQTTLLNLN